MKKKTIVTAEIQFAVGDTATVEFLDLIRLGTSLPVVGRELQSYGEHHQP